ncbi:UNVERIFIED_CONTAM: hypothetical protein NCL1_29390 [Trichonephila clavipes]
MWEALNTISLSIFRTMCESDHLLAHSICNVISCCKPPTTYWFLNLGTRSKSQGEMSGEYGGCSNSSHPQRRSRCRTHSMWSCIVVQEYCTVHKIRTFSPNATSYLSHQEVPVVLCGHCSATRNKVVNNDTPDVINDDGHQLGKDSDGPSTSLVIQHVTTSRTDVSVLDRMSWPKIPRWRLFMTIIDHHPVASVQSGRIILHSATTFIACGTHHAAILRRCSSLRNILRTVSFSMPLALFNSSSIHRSVFIHELLDDGTCQVGPHTDRSLQTLLITS